MNKKTSKKTKAVKSTKPTSNPEIDDTKTFSKLLPPLAKDVYKALKESIRKDGLREPLTVWRLEGKRTLVDGHNRLKICKELGIPYRIREKSFKNEEEVKSWMWENQESRRNMTPYQRIEVVLQFKGVIREQARKRQGGAVCENFNKAKEGKKVNKTKLEHHMRTNEVLGKRAGVSYAQVGKVLKIQQMKDDGIITQDVIDTLRNGDVSIDSVYKEYCQSKKQQPPKQDIEKRSNSIITLLKMRVARSFTQSEDCTSLYDKIIEWAKAKKEGLEK